MQVSNVSQDFGKLGWWSAVDMHFQQQHQQLAQNMRGMTAASATSSTTSNWLHNIFKQGNSPDKYTDANFQQDRATPQTMSNVDTGRTQLQLQHLSRVITEMKVIQHNFEIADITINISC